MSSTSPPDRGRCPTHDLALSPAGDCILCRRTFAPPPSAPRSPDLDASGAPTLGASAPEALPGRPVLGMSLAVVLICVSAVAVRALVREVDSSVHLAPRIHPEYEPLAAAPPAEPPAIAVAPPEPARTPRARPRRASVEPVDPAVPAGAPDRPAPPVRIAPAPGEEALAPGEPPGLAVARRRVSITMYSATWCGSCSRAREYLREHHIRYTNRDIDDGERNRERLRELNPAGSIPTFDIEDRVLVGFHPTTLEGAIDAAAYEILGHH